MLHELLLFPIASLISSVGSIELVSTDSLFVFELEDIILFSLNSSK
jgi:hypothetical protein